MNTSLKARDELAIAMDWYERAKAGLGLEFLSAVDERIQTLTEQPWSGSPSPGQTRSLSVSRFPYVVVFLDRSPVIYIVAVAHTSRRQDYWLDRLGHH